MLSIVHVLNQFFAGLGGEEKAGAPVGTVEGATGAARGLQAQLGAEARVVATVYYGDNYFHERGGEARQAILKEVESRRPHVVVAGPAFDSGRYGVACAELCFAIAHSLEIPCVTAMHPENPGVAVYQERRNMKVFLLPASETAAGMADALAALARFAQKVGSGGEIGPADQEGYIPRGVRHPEKADRSGAKRALEMLLRKIRGERYRTEIPMQTWDHVSPVTALSEATSATIALVTTSGVVPWGNPDGFKTFRNAFWRKYSIAELKTMEPGRWEAVHGGYNVAFMNQNPHYGVPLDALRALEAKGDIGSGKLYPAYYVVPGNQGAPSVMRRIGQEIAADLRGEGVGGVLLVAT